MYRLNALVRLALASAYAPEVLNLAGTTQLVGSLCKRHAVALLLRPLFTPLFGVLPTFPSRYWSTIGLSGVFSLAGWSPLFQTGFLVSRPTQGPFLYHRPCLYGGVTLYAPDFHPVPVRSMISLERPYNPGTAVTAPVWALSVSIATTPDIDDFFLFLRVLRCFSSPR